MKRLFMILVLSVSIVSVSCQQGSQDGNNGTKRIEVDKDGFVSIEISSGNPEATKTEVTSSGVTSWTIGDVVTIIDVEGSKREFNYASKTAQAKAKFTGKLLGGHGSQKYYAYYGPRESPCEPASSNCLSVKRCDLSLSENGELNAKLFGEFCPMVAIPLTFDAQNADDNKNFDFYHVNSLIEARVSSIVNDARLKSFGFNKILFKVIATSEEAPFNSEVHVMMNQILGPPNVPIPYMEFGEKGFEISTRINFRENTYLPGLLALSHTSYFPMPTYALPTRPPFTSDALVEFHQSNAPEGR